MYDREWVNSCYPGRRGPGCGSLRQRRRAGRTRSWYAGHQAKSLRANQLLVNITQPPVEEVMPCRNRTLRRGLFVGRALLRGKSDPRIYIGKEDFELGLLDDLSFLHMLEQFR